MIPCSNRLNALLEWIHGSCLADIGCDHAYLACNAVLSGRVKKAYACDVADGPLAHAKATIEQEQLQEQVILKKMDGMQGLDDDVDICAIAGMGAQTIISILDHATCIHWPILVVSVHKDANQFRNYCFEHGFHIKKERILFEDDHYYPIMMLEKAANRESYTFSDLWLGKTMIKDETYKQYVQAMKEKYERLVEKCPPEKNAYLKSIFDVFQEEMKE